MAFLSAQPDPLVFSQVSARLKPELLGRAVFVNKHCGLLPAYAGVYPVFWALLNREDRLGVTVHVMAEEYDAGELLAQTSVAAQGHSVSSAYHALYDRAADLLLRLFFQFDTRNSARRGAFLLQLAVISRPKAFQ